MDKGGFAGDGDSDTDHDYEELLEHLDGNNDADIRQEKDMARLSKRKRTIAQAKAKAKANIDAKKAKAKAKPKAKAKAKTKKREILQSQNEEKVETWEGTGHSECMWNMLGCMLLIY